MPSTTIQPDGETHDPADAWGPVGGTRLGVVLDDIDANLIVEGNPETDTITFTFNAAPAGALTDGLDVYIRATTGVAWDAYIAAELFILDESKGIVQTPELSDEPAWGDYTLNRPEWDGPWTEEEMATAKVTFWVVGKEATTAAITKLNMPIEYGGLADRSGHGADALRLKYNGLELVQMSRLGTVPGVGIDHVAALNSAATGTIRVEADGQTLRYKAPGSSAYGTPLVVPPSPDIVDVLRDGDDPDQFLRVSVDTSELPSGQAEARVALKRRYVEGFDVTAAQAQAGNVQAVTFVMENASTFILSHLRVWIDASVNWLEISDGPAGPWISPITEAAAQTFPDLAVGGTDNLYVRRTIPAVTGFDPAVPWWLHHSFDGGP